MGDVKIRYYTTRQREGRTKWGYWAPCLARRNKQSRKIEPTLMAKLGFKLVDCGEDGPRAWSIAEGWNRRWDEAFAAHRAGHVVAGAEGPIYPRGSMGEGFAKFKATSEWQRKKPRTREDWERGWKLIAPVFGDVDPRTVALEEIDLWYSGSADGKIAGLLGAVGVREAHRAMKIWRALWRAIGTINNPDGERYCDRDRDPSLGIRRQTPKARSAVWFEGEAVRLVKRAWREGYHGLAAALAVAWDTMLSPVDVVKLTAGQRETVKGAFRFVERTKTSKAVIGTISGRTARILGAYTRGLGFELPAHTPLFFTRGGVPGPKGGRPRPPAVYTRDKLGKDFAKIRDAEFPGDERWISDFRRSGAIEAGAGEVDKAALGAKMGNTIEHNAELAETYLPRSGPQTAVLVDIADAARARGRSRLRNTRGG